MSLPESEQRPSSLMRTQIYKQIGFSTYALKALIPMCPTLRYTLDI